MKILSIILLASIFSFTVVRISHNASSVTENAKQELLQYKQKYALSCGNSTSNFSFADYNFFAPIFQARDNYRLPGALPEEEYNTLWIPDTLSGTTFNLRIHDTAKQYIGTGPSTKMLSFNNSATLGPTLIFKKGTTVQMNVKNDLAEETTVHWHGIHLPAVMDGGPHQPVPAGTTWRPTWTVNNNAATYWYHPHLHMKTAEQIAKGLSGLIIIRDEIESALKLPRTYGVDDIPLILNDKRLKSNNQIEVVPYGDTMLANGVLHAQFNVPAQVVRFRVLDGAGDRCYNIGFSDNRSFSVISSDAGLLDKPVPVTRYILSAGERVEILLNLTGQQSQQVTLRAFNSTLPKDYPGAEPDDNSTVPGLRNRLGDRDFDILRLNIDPPTANAITTIPSSLTVNANIDSTEASVTRTIEMTQASVEVCPPTVPTCAWFNGKLYDMDRIDYEIEEGATEIWQLVNNSASAHPFHIHDISFKLLSKSDGPIPEYEKGWKDVIMVRKGVTVRVIAKFADYADEIHPYMYHCHISFHEDAGMMGQFVVKPAILPVTIVSFAGALTDKNVILLWKAENELNTKMYSVERSTDGINFSAAGTVNAAGKLNYSFTDKNAVTLSGKVYYRLKIIDKDGKYAYSKIINVKRIENSFVIFPNPVAKGSVNIIFNEVRNYSMQLKATDAKGKVVLSQVVPANAQNFSIDINTLKNGMYFLVISDGKGVNRQKFQVLR